VFPAPIEVGTKNISDYDGVIEKKIDRNAKIFTNQPTRDLYDSLTLH
jgi:hypothetical protein